MNYTFTERYKVGPVEPDRLNDHCDRIMETTLRSTKTEVADAEVSLGT